MSLKNLKIEIVDYDDEAAIEGVYNMLRANRNKHGWSGIEIITIPHSLWIVHNGVSQDLFQSIIREYASVKDLRFKAFEKDYVKRELKDYENNGWRNGEPPKDGNTYDATVATLSQPVKVRAARHSDDHPWIFVVDGGPLKGQVVTTPILRWRRSV